MMLGNKSYTAETGGGASGGLGGPDGRETAGPLSGLRRAGEGGASPDPGVHGVVYLTHVSDQTTFLRFIL